MYSPLFIRVCANKHNLNTTFKGVRKRTKQRLEKRILTAKMATMAPPAVVPAKAAWKEDLNLQLICRDCKEVPPNLVEEFASGDTVCGSCGLVLGERIVDTRSEWRTFSNDDQGNDDPSRVGDAPNELMSGEQLHTTISFEAGGNAKSRDLHRAQSKATHDKVSKGLMAAYKEIGALCDSLSISGDTSQTAKGLFKQVSEGNAFRTKSQETVIAGCIFIACRQTGVPRSFREIFSLTKVSKAEIGRTFKALEKFFSAENAKKKAKAEETGSKSSLVRCTFHHVLLTSVVKRVWTRRQPSSIRSPPIQKRFVSVSAIIFL